MDSESPQPLTTRFPVGGGEIGRLIQTRDWSKTPLGPLDLWPQSLKTATNMLLLSPVPIVLLWGEDGVMIYNDAYSVFAGSRHPDLLGSKVREGWSEIADFNDNVMKVGLSGKTLAYENQELTLLRHGSPAPAWMNLDYSPVLDESGKPAGVIAIVVETTKSVLAQRRLRESEERFRAFTTATTDIVYRMSADWKEMQQLDGRNVLADTANPTVAWQEAYLFPEDIPAIQAVIDEAISSKGVFECEHRVRRADGSTGWVLSRAVPLLNDAGAIVEWFGAATDITERRRKQQQLELIVHELNHRVKNNLAMVQAFAYRTFRDADDIPRALDSFTARLVSLGRANDLLTGELWSSASLKQTLDQATVPHRPDGGRWELTGDDIRVSAKTALALTMAFHELGTNAVRHGAWSSDGGAVRVRCSLQIIDDGTQRYRIDWDEHGGPPVEQPKRKGFGTVLIQRGLAAETGGSVDISFAETGFSFRLDAPADRLRNE